MLTASKLVKSSNKFQKHHAAYFAQQSIEKTLKYVIGLQLGNQPWGHDIKALVLQGRQLGINIPQKIIDKADVYTNWESTSRYYPSKVIYRNVIEEAIKVTWDWHKDLKKQGIG